MALSPYWDKIQLALRMEGANGSTSFIDDKGHSVTPTGATISTAHFVHGSSSMLAGSGKKLVVGSSPDFAIGVGDFTVEARVNITSWSQPLQGVFNIGSYNSGLLFRIQNGAMECWINNSTVNPTTTISPNADHHIALTRQSGVVRLWLDGSQVGSDYNLPGSIAANDITIGVSAHNSGEYVDGYIDDVYLTVGVARYSLSFTPPSDSYYGPDGEIAGFCTTNIGEILFEPNSFSTVFGFASSSFSTLRSKYNQSGALDFVPDTYFGEFESGQFYTPRLVVASVHGWRGSSFSLPIKSGAKTTYITGWSIRTRFNKPRSKRTNNGSLSYFTGSTFPSLSAVYSSSHRVSTINLPSFGVMSMATDQVLHLAPMKQTAFGRIRKT